MWQEQRRPQRGAVAGGPCGEAITAGSLSAQQMG